MPSPSGHPPSNSLKLSDQRWYQTSTGNVSMYMNNNSNVIQTGSHLHNSEAVANYVAKPLAATTSNDNAPIYRKSVHHHASSMDVERLLPELLVMEIHRDGNAVTYRHYTIRALYRYVLDAIADRTGVLQAAAYTQLWQKKTEVGQQTVVATTEPTAGMSTSTSSSSDTIPPPLLVPIGADGRIVFKPSSQDIESPVTPSSESIENPHNATSSSPPDTPPPHDNTLQQPSSSSSSSHAGIPLSPAPVVSQPTTNLGLSSSSTHRAQPSTNTDEVPHSNVTYRERLGGYLHPRDMRRLVTPFSTSNEPEIIVRRHAILINYDPLRTIILRDRLLVLVPNGADSLLSKLETRVRGNSSREDMENAIFGTNFDPTGTTIHSTSNNNNNNNTTTARPQPPSVSTSSTTAAGTATANRTLLNKKSASNVSNENSKADSDTKAATTDMAHDSDDDDATNLDEWHEMAAREWVNLPFELQCTDAVLYVVGSILEEETVEVQQAAQTFIERIVRHGGSGLEDDPLTIIRVVKDAVQLMSNRVKSYVQSIHRLLDDDEDMALMNLSRLLTHPERFVQPVPQRILNEESDEPELILEANLQIGLTLVNYIEVIQGQIHTAKELIDQRLDATRNKLLFANMLISVFTLCVTFGTLVGSFFGMNLEFPKPLQENIYAFNQVVGYTCVGCIVLCIIIMIVLLYTDTIPVRFSRRFRPVRIEA